MKRKQKKDINIPIIALLALLLIMLIIVTAITLILNNFKGTDTSNEKNNIVSNSQERPKEYVRLDTVYPMEFDKFLNLYSGNVPKEYILEKITNFVYYFMDNKDIIDNVTDNNISEFYNNNKQTLNNIGITTQEDFQKIVQAVKEINTKSLELSYAQIKTDTLINSNGVTTAEFELKYTYYDPINLEIKINNNYEEGKNLVSFSCYE